MALTTKAYELRRSRVFKLPLRFVTAVDAGDLGAVSPLEMPDAVAVPCITLEQRKQFHKGNSWPTEDRTFALVHVRDVTLA